jgi:acyl-CoA synthetase (AMP-forming)/AMP-acid ligase II
VRAASSATEAEAIKADLSRVSPIASCGSTSPSDTFHAGIIQYVSDVKVQYKWLKGGVEFIDAIPKNPSGKLLRRILREKARADRAASEKAKATL